MVLDGDPACVHERRERMQRGFFGLLIRLGLNAIVGPIVAELVMLGAGFLLLSARHRAGQMRSQMLSASMAAPFFRGLADNTISFAA
ncbi:MAG: hypothetical protein NVSMB42_27060 [Herpetosiphon sp.]